MLLFRRYFIYPAYPTNAVIFLKLFFAAFWHPDRILVVHPVTTTIFQMDP